MIAFDSWVIQMHLKVINLEPFIQDQNPFCFFFPQNQEQVIIYMNRNFGSYTLQVGQYVHPLNFDVDP